MEGCAAGGWYLLISALLKLSTLLPSKSRNGLTGHLHMLVLIRRQGRNPEVSLSQMLAIRGDEATNKAIADWHYGVAQGYRF
jgi:hypothetical protein